MQPVGSESKLADPDTTPRMIVGNWCWYWSIFRQVITEMIGPCWHSSNFRVIWWP